MLDANQLIPLAALDAVPVCLLIFQNNELCFANTQALDLFRTSAGELMDTHAAGRLLPEMAQVMASMGTPPTPSLEADLTRPDGSNFRAQISFTPFPLEDEESALLATVIPFQASDGITKENKARYADLVASLPGIVFRGYYLGFDRFQFNYVSPNSQEINGLPAADVMAHPELWLTFLPAADPEDGQTREQAIRQAARANKLIISECQTRVRGELRWLRTNVRFQILPDGTISVTGVQWDITDQRKTEEALRESEERYRLLVTNSPDTMFFQDLDLRYTWQANPLQAGPPGAFVLGKNDAELLTNPEEADRIMGLKRRVLVTGQPWHGEVHRTLSDGVYFYEAAYTPRFDRGGQIIGLATYLRNITERKQAEQALYQSQALVQHLTEHAPFMLYLFDAKTGQTIYTNQYTSDFFGRSIEDLKHLGNPVTPDLIHPDDLPTVQNYTSSVIRAVEQTNFPPFEYRIKNARGEWRWVMVQTQVLTVNDDQQPQLLLSLVLDITKRKQSEEIEREQRQLLEVLRDTAALMHRTLDLAEVLDHVLATVDRIVPSDGANIMLLDDNDRSSIVRHRGYTVDEITALQTRYADSTRWPFSRHTDNPLQAIYLSDAMDHTDEGWEVKTSWVRSYVVALMYAGGDLIGVVNLVSHTPGFYTAVHAERLQAFANQAAAAIQNAYLHQKSQALAASHERQRLARELHDSVTQTLFSASMVAQTLPHLLKRGDAEVNRGLAELSRLTIGALAEMRTMLIELRPAAIETANLTDLITYLLNAMVGHTATRYRLVVRGTAPILPEVQVAAYRVTQEALNNLIKHADADRVAVQIWRKPDQLRVRIRDNGAGFDSASIPADHFGLGIMVERAASVGATLTIKSAVGCGTDVLFIWRAPVEQIETQPLRIQP